MGLASARAAMGERPDTQQGRRDSSSSLGSALVSPRKGGDLRTDNVSSSHNNLKRVTSKATRDAERIAGGSIRRLKSGPPKSLLPVTERRSQEENKVDGRSRREGETDRSDITPDGGSAGREGRQFAVVNVGNNGRIYLRPTIRPAHQRYPQPNFVFPMTPPATATLESTPTTAERGESASRVYSSVLHESQWTLAHTPTVDSGSRRLALEGRVGPRHRRAVSDSTVPDTSVARDSDVGAFKVVITHPGDEARPKTGEADQRDGPFLDVVIPSWKLGSPRFTPLGTPIIRGSSAGALTEEIRSSIASPRPATPQQQDYAKPKKPDPISIPRIQVPQVEVQTSPVLFSPFFPKPLRSTYLSTHLVIEPAMFDDLTFKPACDDRSIVRYSPSTGAVTAATPPRLVAEITSPSFLDYELLSDFFLTFRAFLECNDLLKMLIARLRWAIARDDEAGMVVRVRTFVALRHWILNYFMDDFVVDYQLRVMFCNLVNDMVDELSRDANGGKVQVKILGELKKCWRRICAHYWDGPEFDSSLGPEVPIAPGGIAGHRSPALDPGFWETDRDQPRQLDTFFALPENAAAEGRRTSFAIDVSRAGHIDSVVGSDRPGSPEQQEAPTTASKRSQASPLSISSIDVISCSFPTKNMLFSQPPNDVTPAAHPVDPTSLSTANMDPVATTPRALAGKRVRPQQQSQHKRNGSLTDSLRDHATAGEKLLFKNTELLMSIPYAGSLVRGAMFPPAQAYVEVPPPNSAGAPRQTTVFHAHPLESQKAKESASAMSSQGMRKLLSSVRRALSSRGQGVSPTQGTFINISPIGPRGATTNRLPGTAIVPQARPRLNGTRPPVRIDLLGAEVAEDFKKAVREDAAAEAAKFGHMAPGSPEDAHGQPSEGTRLASLGHFGSSLQPRGPSSVLRPSSDAAITTGSQSIVIVDDTSPPDVPLMTGALPASSHDSFEAFAEALLNSGADPTPPNTPPGQTVDTPRKSWSALRHHVMRQANSEETIPPLTDMPRPGSDFRMPPSAGGNCPSLDFARPSLDYSRQSSSRPPLSGVRGHFRHPSSRSYRSNHSFGRRRYASFTSGIAPQPTLRSFDASTYSEGSVDEAPLPQPLRVLRRRPGGDLRAATNVGELHPLRRSRSVGSLTTYSESLRSSYIRNPGQDSSGFVDVVTSDYSDDRMATFSLGAMTEQHPKKVSLFSTHSSKPVMRPSFEAEAKKLAQIPDDADDDGGVEAALLKLEGKFDKKAFKLSMEPSNVRLPSLGADDNMQVTKEEKMEHRHLHIADDTHLSQMVAHKLDAGDSSDAGTDRTEKPPSNFLRVSHPSARPDSGPRSYLSGESGESYSSIPILERGLADEAHSEPPAKEWTGLSVLQDEDAPTPTGAESPRQLEHLSYDFVSKTDSLERIMPGETLPPPLQSPASFLDDDSDAGTDLSSELSVDLEDEGDIYVRKRADAVISRLPAHPLGEPSPTKHGHQPQPQGGPPPSPPITLAQALKMSPETAHLPKVREQQVYEGKPLPPTPDTTPTTAAHEPHALDSARKQTGSKEALSGTPKAAAQPNATKFSVHLPFILAFDSEILAQQFTLIEKDALNEIDWKELIDMRWKNAENIDARSWVDFLRNSDARGVEVVIARFNIMVKWCVSEVVLTQDLEERARCVIKFIHIAAHCRRYRNFATMSQIAIALTSPDISKLSKTWAMVPPTDLATLRGLETLVSPTRNFYTLRAEMEGVGIASAEMGCIPFVGIYTHDLLFNSQRPSEIASSPTTAPLVNFERCRIAAGIVKTLLRLLEASTLYGFQPIEGITERCLWMGALTDDQIRRLSDSLETSSSVQ